MTVFAPLTMASRALVTVIVAAVFMLGAASVATHPGDGCNDELCTTLQCDMATGNGCGSLCVHAALMTTAARPTDARASSAVAACRDTGPGLRVPHRPFRPPALS